MAVAAGHENHISARHGEVGGDACPLVAGGLLDHLDQHLLSLSDHLLDFQILPVGGGRHILAVIFRMDVAKGQKAVALDAHINKNRLQIGFDGGDDALVNVTLGLGAGNGFHVERGQFAVFKQGNARLFRLVGVDEQFQLGVACFSLLLLLLIILPLLKFFLGNGFGFGRFCLFRRRFSAPGSRFFRGRRLVGFFFRAVFRCLFVAHVFPFIWADQS